MKIDFTTEITNIEGIPMRFETSAGLSILTLRDVCVNALLTNDTSLSGMDKKKYADLADKIYKNKTLDLSLDEAKLLKDLIGKLFSPWEIKRAWDILDPKKDN